MSDGNTHNQVSVLDELLIDEALFGLEADRRRSLDQMLDDGSVSDSDAFSRVVASCDAVFASADAAELPASLADKVRATIAASGNSAPPVAVPAPVSIAEPTIAGRIGAEPQTGPRNAFSIASLGWIAAAACLVIAAVSWMDARPAGDASISDRYDAFVAAPPADVFEADWTTLDDPSVLAEAVAGEVIWADSTNSGFMVFEGLAANDPTEWQYQLWIFDAERSEAHPVDGGVFDIAEGGGPSIVPIDPRVPVTKATMFAITVERPGGVVVSDRSRLPVLAQRPAI